MNTPLTLMNAPPEGRPPLRMAVLCLTAFALACSDASSDGPSAPQGGSGPDGSTEVRVDAPSLDGGTSGRDGGDATPAPDGGDGGTDSDASSEDATPSVEREDNRERDSDCDGLSDQAEFANRYPGDLQTQPDDEDSDDDGLPDGLEIGVVAAVPSTDCSLSFDLDPSSRTLPTEPDTDGDGLLDGVEDANRNGRVDPGETDPLDSDSDDDQIPDGVEDQNLNGQLDSGETDPLAADSDDDGLPDGIEDLNRNGVRDAGELDPTSVDTDGDGLLDGVEDINANGLREVFETDGTNPDTDCDGISDGDELLAMPATSPLAVDSDLDGLPDGLEAGVTTAVSGSGCPPPTRIDADVSTTTNGAEPDSDGDGLADGLEDTNQNGRVDAGETDPNLADSDMDGVSDGTEQLAGTNPLEPETPEELAGLIDVCANQNLVPIVLHTEAQRWTVATTSSASYQAVAVSVALQNTLSVAALDDASSQVAGFVVAMPLFAGAVTAESQEQALSSRINSGLTAEGISEFSTRSTPVFGTSHDGFAAGTSALVDVRLASGHTAAVLRNAMLRLVTGEPATSFSGLPTATGSSETAYIYGFQVLVRDNRLFVMGAVLSQTRFENGDPGRFVLQDLTNGTSLARPGARLGRGCDPITATQNAKADFIWMADYSGSTNRDRDVIAQAASSVFQALQNNNVDFRMAVVSHDSNRFSNPSTAGVLEGVGFTSNQTTFTDELRTGSGTGCELGLTAAEDALLRALPRTAPGSDASDKIRDGAQIAIVYVSDEFAEEVTEQACGGYSPSCQSGIRDLFTGGGGDASCQPTIDQTCFDSLIAPYIQTLRANDALAFAQVVEPQTPAVGCSSYGCNGDSANEPGLGYVEVVNAVGGTFYSPCNASPGGALDEIVNRVTIGSSQFVLTQPPVSASIKVGLVRDGSVIPVPRSISDGFDYGFESGSNEHKIFISGATYRPSLGERIVISYRAWEPVPSCPVGQVFDAGLGICVCDLSICNQNCGPNEVCDSVCGCTCSANCNGNCGPGEVCNQTSCDCECPADCGGCPTGTTCNQTTCQCECDNCGGACDGNNTACDLEVCICECDETCGGACANNQVCNDSTCDCECTPNCDDQCSGFETCNAANNCACECPANCGDNCFGQASCNQAACACECPASCTCPGNLLCNPLNGCACECPFDCGGCGPGLVCNRSICQCEPPN